jgi:hypothetical protein
MTISLIRMNRKEYGCHAAPTTGRTVPPELSDGGKKKAAMQRFYKEM